MESIVIKCKDNEERNRIGTKIHEQLKGNQDYVDSNIILNIDTDKEVGLYVFTDGVVPELKI